MAVVSVMLAAACAWGQPAVVPISGQVVNQFGQPLPFATVRICSVTSTGSPCTPVATTYLDYNSGTTTPQPYAADQFGNYLVYAQALSAPNLYEIQVFPASGITWTYVVKGPQTGGGGGGTVFNFASGNLNPLFNTSVANPNGPNVSQTFTLQNAADVSFFGNVSGSTGPPSYIHFLAGSNITFTPSGGNTLTFAASGGGGTGCVPVVAAGQVLLSGTSGTCTGSLADYDGHVTERGTLK